ncbi:MAG: hypothetical protein U0167_13415 [bacterium]
MEDRLRRLERSVEDLSAALAGLASRVEALERGSEKPRSAPSPEAIPPSPRPVGFSLPGVLALAGRTFLVLGGAFLLRTITDAGVVPRSVGTALGLLYAAIWVLLAGRAGRRAQAGASFHALAAVVIAYPIVFEAATAFRVLSPLSAAILLAAVTGLGLAVAVRIDLPAAGWLFSLGATATAVALLFATRAVATFLTALLAVTAATAWLARVRGWPGPRWVAAAALDLSLVWSISLVTDPQGLPEAYAHVGAPSIRALALAVALLSLASSALNTLTGRRTLGPFDIAQAAAALFIGFGGAARITRFLGQPDTALGLVALVGGATSYAVAFALVRRRQGRNRNFFFHSSLGLLLLLWGAQMAVSPDASSLVAAALALVTAILGGRYDRVTLRAHAAVYAAIAAAQCGLLRFVADAFTRPAARPWPDPSRTQEAVVALLALAYVVLVATRAFRRRAPLARIPRFVIGLLAAAGTAATALTLGLALLPGGRAQAGGPVLAVARTAVLAALAVALAATRRASGLREVGWPVYPILAAGAAKLLVEDIPSGRPLTLFVGFALYGAALIVAPRLARVAAPAAPPPSSPAA